MPEETPTYDKDEELTYVQTLGITLSQVIPVYIGTGILLSYSISL